MNKFGFDFSEQRAFEQWTETPLPNEARIVAALEAAVLYDATGIDTREETLGHSAIPFLFDLCKFRSLQRRTGIAVQEFENAALRKFENGAIDEDGVWEIFERVEKVLRA